MSTPEQIDRIDIVQELIGLLARSRWRRLEVCRGSAGGEPNGYCVDGEGRKFTIRDVLRSKIINGIASIDWLSDGPLVQINELLSNRLVLSTREVSSGNGDRERLLRTIDAYGWTPVHSVEARDFDTRAILVKPTHVCPRCHSRLNVHYRSPSLSLACIETVTCGWTADTWGVATEYEETSHART